MAPAPASHVHLQDLSRPISIPLFLGWILDEVAAMGSLFEKVKVWSSTKDTRAPSGDAYTSDSEPSVIRDGDLAYTLAKAGNGSKPSYQEAVGAPVESQSPLGYQVSWITVIFLNVNQMIGTGIFSTPGTILKGTGSVGLALIYWVIGFFMAIAGFGVYLELASYFPNRSGSEAVYLEQAYPRPKYLFPIAFAVQSVILSFSSSNAIVLARYTWRIAEKSPSPWQLNGVAVAAYTLAVICVIAHNKYSLWATNVFGVLKVITLIFISITGLVVLGGNVDKIADPGVNFRNSFEGTTDNGNDLAVALVNIVFSYTGYANAFNVVNEIKNPIQTIRKSGFISVLVVALLYIFCNIAYFAAVPKDEFKASKEISAAVFFTTVFGRGRAETALNVLVLLSAFGNLLAVLIGQSRLIREIGRQGVLPFPKFWVTTKPFGTPIGPYLLKWAVTFIMIVGPPAGDAFQFGKKFERAQCTGTRLTIDVVVSLKTYPDGIFHLAMAIGLYLIRIRRKRVGKTDTGFKVWDVLLIFFILIQLYIVATPWIPPKTGIYGGSVSFFYATYCLVGIGVYVSPVTRVSFRFWLVLTVWSSLIICGLYYYAWMHLLPKWGKYAIRSEVLDIDDNGANTHRLVKVPLAEVEQWDATHDDAGNLRRRHSAGDSPDEASNEEKGPVVV
ncbi:High-affinity methionine permease [Paramyrothecium foliicola]|nr:High-affinity methionine permease [Paramyrothecium foliicola]